jgi:formylglycine-generating enzyme required for sulfatase activity
MSFAMRLDRVLQKRLGGLIWKVLAVFAVSIGMFISMACSGGGSATAAEHPATYALTVSLSAGVTGTPSASQTCTSGDTVNYMYSLQSGYTSLVVTLDGSPVTAIGSVTMNAAHTLAVSATPGLAITITGLGSLDADVTVTGPSGYTHHLTATETLTSLANGTYTITAATVTDTGQPGLGRYNGGTLGPDHLQRYPYQPVQTMTVSGGVGTVSVIYPAATLTVQIPKLGLTGTVPMDFVLVPAGSFIMGNVSSFGAQPPHVVTFDSAFYIAKTELAQTQWTAIMGYPHTNWSTGDTLPVEEVSWDEIKTSFLPIFNNSFSKAYGFRLPSEAEWEYACRAGTTTDYFFPDTPCEYCRAPQELYTYAVFDSARTASVASKAPNPWGLYDIVGNVAEWTEDDYHDNYIGAPTDGSAWVDITRSDLRVARGSVWLNISGSASHSAFRGVGSAPGAKNYSTGFRVVMPVPGVR